VTPRMVVTDTKGRECIVYRPNDGWPRPCSAWAAAALDLNLRYIGHWNYDRCVVEGASDLGSVTVDGAL
jgi:hypothetical protein